jgi:hypothetical protein
MQQKYDLYYGDLFKGDQEKKIRTDVSGRTILGEEEFADKLVVFRFTLRSLCLSGPSSCHYARQL